MTYHRSRTVGCDILQAQNKEGILPVATERAWLVWPNKLFRGRECTPLPRVVRRGVYFLFLTHRAMATCGVFFFGKINARLKTNLSVGSS